MSDWSAIELRLAEHPEERFVVLFGSRQRDAARPDSDGDVAVYLDDDLDADQRFAVRRRIIAGLAPELNVDLVLLNEAPPLLAHRALGRLVLLMRNRRRYVRFFVRTISRGQSEEALLQMKRAVKLEPASPRVLIEAGSAHLFAGELRQAIDLCTQAVQLAPEATGGHRCLSQALWAAGDGAAAQRSNLVLARANAAPESVIREMEAASPEAAFVVYQRWRAAETHDEGVIITRSPPACRSRWKPTSSATATCSRRLHRPASKAPPAPEATLDAASERLCEDQQRDERPR